MTLTASDITAPLARYAARLHACAGPRHHVASPLGAWLLLALCAPASGGPTREILERTLGCDPAEAAELAAALLTSPHSVVPAAAAVWHDGDAPTEAVARWLAGLPPAVATGPVPDPADLDEWARRRTFGLIDRFPLPDNSPFLLAATVLATRVSWQRPFDLAPAGSLGPSSPWAGAVGQVLRTPHGPGHEQFVAATQAAGDVAVHTARGRGGLLVTSVAAAPSVPAADVLAAAYHLATTAAATGSVSRRSLFDLPLGEGPLWAITERTGPIRGAAARAERCTAVLPAWSARSEHDLSEPGLGFAAAAQALAPGRPWRARQAAMARYGRVGFEAAAVTGAAAAMAMVVPRRGLIRTAELRFGHPFAVVAVTVGEPGNSDPAAGRSWWHGVPVFSAWVAWPEEAGQQ